MVARRTRSHYNPPSDTVPTYAKATEAKRKLISTPEPSAESLDEYTGKTDENHELVDLTTEEGVENRKEVI